jgi:hypothetical protein
MNKKIVFAALVSVALVSALLALSFPDRSIRLVFATGEAFRNVYVEQYQGSSWATVVNATTSGTSTRIYDSQIINFTVQVLLDYTYAASSSDAITYVNITAAIKYNTNATYVTGWQEIELTNATAAIAYQSNTYWLVTKCGNWTSYRPAAGTTYTVTFNYQAYY